MEKEYKKIRWFLPPIWLETYDLHLRGWKQVDGKWNLDDNVEEIIVKVMRKKKGKWVTTNHRFTKERAEHIARSMEQVTGAPHEVVDA
jgi:hypothetical protein